MKKIKTLFPIEYENHKWVGISREVRPEFAWVLDGEGVATVKWDGTACAIIDGNLYTRLDVKNGRKKPDGAIPCMDKPDEITSSYPHWVPVLPDDKGYKWVWAAYQNSLQEANGYLPDATYEAVGKHFQGNPYGFDKDILIQHGQNIVEVPRTFDGIKEYLYNTNIEGLVFWKDNEPQCKIRKVDFGYEWNHALERKRKKKGN